MRVQMGQPQSAPRPNEWHPLSMTRRSVAVCQLTSSTIVEARSVSTLPPRTNASEPRPPSVASAWPQKNQLHAHGVGSRGEVGGSQYVGSRLVF